jgi:signal transduction histidine kinase
LASGKTAGDGAAKSMPPGFRITARTLFHLGADLISTDAMALYELVKNAFDAGSPRVSIGVVSRVPVGIANPLLDKMARLIERESREEEDEDEDEEELDFEELQQEALQTLDEFQDEDIYEEVGDAEDIEELFDAYVPVNEIVVSDTGHGMTLTELRDIFLTVGTMSRKDEVDRRRQTGVADGTRPILGEKGVGRLSTMRLGARLLVESGRITDARQNLLDLDWSLFSRKPEALLEEIEVAPSLGDKKGKTSGTNLYIRQLDSDWTITKLNEIARDQFSRLNDPFEASARFPIDLSFNGSSVVVPSFRSLLLNEAHATVSARLQVVNPRDRLPNGRIRPGAKMALRGEVNYRLRRKTHEIDLEGVHLMTAAGTSGSVLRSLGEFDLKLYWYNRTLLEEIETIGDKKAVNELVKQWSGGVMVYRDGFRVGGYGSGADDWLGLDRKALASGGFKVNRAQLIGRLQISSLANPTLIDQTNREGLRDSPEKEALIALLKHVVENIFRPFLTKVDEEIQAKEPVDVSKLANRVLKQRRTIAQTLRLLYERYPAVKKDPLIGGRIEEALASIGEMMRSLEDIGDSYKRGRTEMTVLAGIGLSVASIAHDLRQVTNNAVALVDQLRRRRLKTDLPTALAPLSAQLKTLLTRLRVLDPLVTSGRQVKQDIELVEWVPNIVNTALPAFQTDEVDIRVVHHLSKNSDDFEVRVVPGMVVQVVSNLLDNARFWVKRKRIVEEDEDYEPSVLVEVDEVKREIRVSDNGPGVEPSMRNTIFDAFVSTKPPTAGVGLGLFISREIAAYSDATLVLLDEDDTADDMTTTFALRFSKGGK